jgi:hypothetical protein
MGVPEPGQDGSVRSRQDLVEEVVPPPNPADQTLVRLSCLDDDAQGQELEALWERLFQSPGRAGIQVMTYQLEPLRPRTPTVCTGGHLRPVMRRPGVLTNTVPATFRVVSRQVEGR